MPLSAPMSHASVPHPPIPGAAAHGAASGRPRVEHAYLQVHDPPRDGNTAQPGAKRHRIAFQFNPKDLHLTRTAKWTREPQRGATKSGPPEYVGAEPLHLTLELFLDATHDMGDSVVKSVQKLFDCCVPTRESLRANRGSPPWVVFHWGGAHGVPANLSFPAHVMKVDAKYTLFTRTGLPVRAVCTVSIVEIGGEQSGTNPTSGSLVSNDSRTVVAGDTLASVATDVYGDPGMWRALAEANGIDDPMQLQPGRSLLIPAAEEVARHA